MPIRMDAATKTTMLSMSQPSRSVSIPSGDISPETAASMSTAAKSSTMSRPTISLALSLSSPQLSLSDRMMIIVDATESMAPSRVASRVVQPRARPSWKPTKIIITISSVAAVMTVMPIFLSFLKLNSRPMLKVSRIMPRLASNSMESSASMTKGPAIMPAMRYPRMSGCLNLLKRMMMTAAMAMTTAMLMRKVFTSAIVATPCSATLSPGTARPPLPTVQTDVGRASARALARGITVGLH